MLLNLIFSAAAVAAAPAWEFIQAGTTGILALEAIVVSPNLVLFFDRPQDDPLQIDGHSAWGALWNIKKNVSTALRVTTNSFCASGALLSNGSMISLGGNPTGLFPADGDQDGRQSIRIFEPCADPNGVGCELFENVTTHHLAEPRWYPTAIKIFDGSLMIIGGIGINTPFYNTLPINSFEFFPKKDGGVPRNSSFLARSVPANLFPRAFQLPDGQIFMVANNQTVLYNLDTQVETILPDIPNGVRVTNPFDGTAALLPLVPPLYTPEVLVCGGTNISDSTVPTDIDVETPASNQCSRIKLTPEGIKAGWQIEHMLEGRMMPEMILMPNGQILILNGAQTGTAALASIKNPIGNSNSDHPALTPSLYTPDAPLGQRISNKGLPTSEIARVYHSVVTMIPDGRILVAGSNPNPNVTLGVKFPTEFRLEYLNPPFISMARPAFQGTVNKILFGQTVIVPISIPKGMNTSDVKVSLVDLGFSSHAWHSSSRLVFLEHTVARDGKSITFTGPPNGKIFPPGPGVVFLTINDVTSEGLNVMIGSGRSPPTLF